MVSFVFMVWFILTIWQIFMIYLLLARQFFDAISFIFWLERRSLPNFRFLKARLQKFHKSIFVLFVCYCLSAFERRRRWLIWKVTFPVGFHWRRKKHDVNDPMIFANHLLNFLFVTFAQKDAQKEVLGGNFVKVIFPLGWPAIGEKLAIAFNEVKERNDKLKLSLFLPFGSKEIF